MPKSRVIAILSLFVLSVLLTACGNDDDTEATVEPTATRQPVTAVASPAETDAAATADAGENALAAPTAQRVSRPPAVMNASPTMAEVTAATPVASPDATPGTASSPLAMPVQATVVLGGVEQQDYLLTDEGCVGLGEWRALKPGAQVIVRNADGTVVDVGELQAIDSGDDCRWVAELSVPDSEFVSISVPMVTEVWFESSDLESGMVEITLP